MRTARNLKWTIVLATALGVGLWGAATRTAFARGDGGHEEHHSAEHHEEHHEARHEEHHDDHHWNHHHHDWHYAGWGWGPGFWGGAAVGYGLGSWGGWAGNVGGGDTYIDNSDSGNTTENATPLADTDSSEEITNQYDPANQGQNPAQQVADNGDAAAPGGSTPPKLPVDVWPELGISTFTGHKADESGLVVVRVKPKSVAQQAGLVPGDVILKFNGQATPNDETLETLLESAHGNFELSVVDANSGEPRTITGELSSSEKPAKPAG